MPASMIIAVTGGIPKVTGSSTATPAEGPIPGRAPMIVPSRTPTKAKRRFVGVNAIEKPSSRSPNSMRSESEGAGRDRNAQEVDEDEVDEDDGGETGTGRGQNRQSLHHQRQIQQECEQRRQEPHQGPDDQHRGGPGGTGAPRKGTKRK